MADYPQPARCDPSVRRATAADLPLLPEIDERAEALFRAAGIDLPRLPLTLESLRAAAAVFVAGQPPVGFAQVGEIDGCAHLWEIAVLPSQMRRGIGGRLLEAVCDWARSAGYPAVTLTTYAELSWNGPYYRARGFVEMDEPTAGLVAARRAEVDEGLDAFGRRIVMRRPL